MVIYKITNTVTGKLYIGLTSVSLRERWTNHKSNCKNPDKYTSALYCSMRKHGIDNFTIGQIDTATSLEELNIKEQTYIKALNTLAPNGYNLDDGGGSQNCHPDTRVKISKALKGRAIKNRMNGAPKGRPVSLERRKQISTTLKGRSAIQNNEPVRDIETGEIFKSQKEAALKLKVSRQTINKWTKLGRLVKV